MAKTTKTPVKKEIINESPIVSNKKQNSKDNTTLVILGSSLLTIVIVIASMFYIIPKEVKNQMMDIEYSKVWWKANYDIVSKAQLIQITQQLSQIKDYVDKNKDTLPAEDTTKTDTWDTTKTTDNNKVEEKWKLEVFLMGYCPFWEIAAKQLPAILKQFKNDNINLDIHFIAEKTGEWFQAKDFNSLHWVTEAEEDIRQLCIKRDYGVNKLVDYLQVRYANADNYGKVSEWPEKAIESIKWDVKKIAECVTNWEGGKLLAEDIKIAQSNNIGASPTWLANAKFQFGWIEGKKIAEEFCKNNWDLTSCKEWIKIESNSSNPNSTPACNN